MVDDKTPVNDNPRANEQRIALQPWRKRELLDHRKLNEPVDVLNRLNRGVRNPQAINPGIPRMLLKQFIVREEFDEYLEAAEFYYGTEFEGLTQIAKPPTLREGTGDFEVDEEIHAILGAQGGTGVTVEGEKLVWLAIKGGGGGARWLKFDNTV